MKEGYPLSVLCLGSRLGCGSSILYALLAMATFCCALEISPNAEQVDQTGAGLRQEGVRMLAFQRNRGVSYEIGLIDEQGVRMQILAEGALYHPAQCWSPDGRRIAFVAGPPFNEICVINSDGAGKRQVTNHQGRGMFFDWGRKGKSILYATEKLGQYTMVELNLDSGERNTITEKGPNVPCAWSEIGDTIVIQHPESTRYEMTRDGERLAVKYYYSSDMRKKITVRTRRDATSSRQLSSVAYISDVAGNKGRLLLELEGMLLRDFSFSDDNKRIAFIATRGTRPASGVGDEPDARKSYKTGIYVTDTFGRETRCVVVAGVRAVWQPIERNKNGQQDGARQPAAPSESKAEDESNPEP